MKEISHLLAVIAFLATVGSFLIELRQEVDRDREQGPQTTPQLVSPSSGNGGAGKAKPPRPECNRDVYEATARRLRAERGSKVSRAQRFQWLGTDPYYDYYFDHAAGAILCLSHSKVPPFVHPSRTDRKKRKRSVVVWWSIVVIILSGVGLAIIEVARSSRTKR
jgi:hypothetical protein